MRPSSPDRALTLRLKQSLIRALARIFPRSTTITPCTPPLSSRPRAGILDREEAERLAKLLGVLSDHVKARLLFALVSVDELCVGDLAIALGDVSEDQTSYALKTLRNAGLVQTRRDGRVINYRLDGFPHQLLEHCGNFSPSLRRRAPDHCRSSTTFSMP